MAVAGTSTGAYRCYMVAGVLRVMSTTALRSECAPATPETALRIIAGETLTVAGGDVVELRRLVNGAIAARSLAVQPEV